jgi:hypothetical protein
MERQTPFETARDGAFAAHAGACGTTTTDGTLSCGGILHRPGDVDDQAAAPDRTEPERARDDGPGVATMPRSRCEHRIHVTDTRGLAPRPRLGDVLEPRAPSSVAPDRRAGGGPVGMSEARRERRAGRGRRGIALSGTTVTAGRVTGRV